MGSRIAGFKDGATPPYDVAFTVYVFDNSDTIAWRAKTIIYQIDAHDSVILFMRDDHRDVGAEYNEQTPPDAIWASPDLWNRQNEDIIFSDDHQNPIPDTTNYLKVRIRNIGCADFPQADTARLRLYWTWAAFDEKWPQFWTDGVHGDEITNSDTGGIVLNQQYPIPAGRDTVVSVAWTPPNPNTLPDSLRGKNHLCLLARIETERDTAFGMTTHENHIILRNVLGNSKIVTRNTEVIDLGPGGLPPPGGGSGTIVGTVRRVIMGNPTSASFPARLTFQTTLAGPVNDNLPDYGGMVNIQLNGPMYTSWVSGGRQVHGAVDLGGGLFRLTSLDSVVIGGITIPAGVRAPVDVLFMYDTTQGPRDARRFEYRFIQTRTDSQEVTGGVQYVVNLPAHEGVHESFTETSPPGAPSGETLRLYPNPAGDRLTLEWSSPAGGPAIIDLLDMGGRFVRRLAELPAGVTEARETLSLAGLPAGAYIVRMQTPAGLTYRRLLRTP